MRTIEEHHPCETNRNTIRFVPTTADVGELGMELVEDCL